MEIAGGETKQWFFDCCSNLACVCVLSRLSRVQLFATVWTVTLQISLLIGFSRQEYWNGLPCPSPGDLPDRWIEPETLVSLMLAGILYHKCQLGNLIPYSQSTVQRQSYG